MTNDFPLNVLLVTFQTGCANSIVLIAKALRQRGARIHGVCAGACVRVFEREAVSHQVLDVNVSDAQIDALLDAQAPDLVITGSNAANRFEFNFRLRARQRGVQVITTLDYWSAYQGRFHDNETGVTSLPDKLLVTDAVMRDELRKAGFKDARIEIVGNPYFEHLALEASATRNPRIRAYKRILFTSQPIAALFGTSSKNPRFLGYEEGGVFDALVDDLKARPECRLYVKPHPREDLTVWRGRLKKAKAVEKQIFFIGGRGRSLGLLQAADVVVGMTSNMLLEALVVGTAAVSFQPDTNGKFEFYGTSSGLVPTARKIDRLPPLIDEALTRSATTVREKVGVLYKGALARCIDVITAK